MSARAVRDFIAQTLRKLPEALTNDIFFALCITAGVVVATLPVLCLIASTRAHAVKPAAGPVTAFRTTVGEAVTLTLLLFWTNFGVVTPAVIAVRFAIMSRTALCAAAEFLALSAPPHPSVGSATLVTFLNDPLPGLDGSAQRVFAASALALGAAAVGLLATAAGSSAYWVAARTTRRLGVLVASAPAGLAAFTAWGVVHVARSVDARELLGCPPPSVLAAPPPGGDLMGTRARIAIAILAVAAAVLGYVWLLIAQTGPKELRQQTLPTTARQVTRLAPDEPLLRVAAAKVGRRIAAPFHYLFFGEPEWPRCCTILAFFITIPVIVIHTLAWLVAVLATALSFTLALGTAEDALEVMAHLHVVPGGPSARDGALLPADCAPLTPQAEQAWVPSPTRRLRPRPSRIGWFCVCGPFLSTLSSLAEQALLEYAVLSC